MSSTVTLAREPVTVVDREWIASMLESLEAGRYEDVREILEAALRVVDTAAEQGVTA